ncbi:MAG: glutaredoxin family protein [Arenicella sp.]|nr:glutaredoxin family protein [Arenicella sp.]
MKLTILKTHSILKIFLLSIIALAASNAHAGKLYKWVDANGNISYQDQPPPKSGKILSEKEVISKADDKQENDTGLPKVVVYSVSECELCDRLIRVLTQNKVPHIELPLEDDREAQRRILAKSNSIIAPTIFIGDNIVQGGSEDSLKEQLRSAGFEIAEAKQVKSSNRLTVDQ